MPNTLNAAAIAREIRERAYAIGRRSETVDSVVSGIRAMRASLLRPPNFVAGELASLLTFLRNAGCTFHDCVGLGEAPMPMGVAFRYDVHVRDIAGCHAFAEAHRAQQAPATFFLMWDYSGFERRYEDRFCSLARKLTGPLRIGLHDSPVDAYLIKTQFRDDRGRYRAWLKANGIAWLSRLADDETELRRLNTAVLQDFVERVNRTNERFGPVASVAAHGGEMSRMLQEKKVALSPKIDRIARALLPAGWLTSERVAAAGLQACVDNFSRSGTRWRQISDGGGSIVRMAQLIDKVLLRHKAAAQFLLHPFTWYGAKRDGELSRLLRE